MVNGMNLLINLNTTVAFTLFLIPMIIVIAGITELTKDKYTWKK